MKDKSKKMPILRYKRDFQTELLKSAEKRVKQPCAIYTIGTRGRLKGRPTRITLENGKAVERLDKNKHRRWDNPDGSRLAQALRESSG